MLASLAFSSKSQAPEIVQDYRSRNRGPRL